MSPNLASRSARPWRARVTAADERALASTEGSASRSLKRLEDPRAKRALVGLFAGALLGGALLALLGGAVLYAYWLHRCGVHGVCDDPARVARWSSLHALLMGMHGAGVGAAIGLVAGLLTRARHAPRASALAGGGFALVLGAIASRPFWMETGTAAVAVISLPLHVTVGAVLAFAISRRVRDAAT